MKELNTSNFYEQKQFSGKESWFFLKTGKGSKYTLL